VVIADGARATSSSARLGRAGGTHFLPTGDRMESRRRYLLSGLQSRGRVVVDEGAARALLAAASRSCRPAWCACEGAFAAAT
jgi:glutamate 5-kinase